MNETISDVIDLNLSKNSEDLEQFAVNFYEFQYSFFMWHKSKSKNIFENIFDNNGKTNDSLSETQYRILIVTHKAKRVTISDFVRHFNVTKSSLSSTVSKLVDEGYLIREKSKDGDARKVYFYLTEKGQVKCLSIKDHMVNRFKLFYSELSLENQESLKKGIECFNKIF